MPGETCQPQLAVAHRSLSRSRFVDGTRLATPPIRVRQLHALCVGAATAVISCADPLEPFASCEGEVRTPAFCTGNGEQLCQCADCLINGDAGIMCLMSLELAEASCLPDGSDWKTCACNPAPPR